MEDGVSTVCVERAAIGERDGKLLEPVDEMIGVRNAAYVVGCEVVPYLEAPIPRHRRDLTIDETCSLRCDLLAEIFRDAGKKLASRIRYEILGRVGRRHGKAGLHGGGLAILRLGKDAKIKRRGGYTTKAMTATMTSCRQILSARRRYPRSSRLAKFRLERKSPFTKGPPISRSPTNTVAI